MGIHLKYHDDFMDVLDSQDVLGFDFDDDEVQEIVDDSAFKPPGYSEILAKEKETTKELNVQFYDDYVNVTDSKEATSFIDQNLSGEIDPKSTTEKLQHKSLQTLQTMPGTQIKEEIHLPEEKENTITQTFSDLLSNETEKASIHTVEVKKEIALERNDNFVDKSDSKQTIAFNSNSEIKEVGTKQGATMTASKLLPGAIREQSIQDPKNIKEIHLEYHDDILDILDSKDGFVFGFDGDSDVGEVSEGKAATKPVHYQKEIMEEKGIKKSETVKEQLHEHHDDLLDILGSVTSCDLDYKNEEKEVSKQKATAETVDYQTDKITGKDFKKSETINENYVEYHDDFVDILGSKDTISSGFELDEKKEVKDISEKQATVETSKLQSHVTEEKGIQKPDSKAEVHLEYHDDFMDILDSKDTIGFDFDDESEVTENSKEQSILLGTPRVQESVTEEKNVQKPDAKTEVHLEYHDDFMDILDSEDTIGFDFDDESEETESPKDQAVMETSGVQKNVTDEKGIPKTEAKKEIHLEYHDDFMDILDSKDAIGFDFDDESKVTENSKDQAMMETSGVQKSVTDEKDIPKIEAKKEIHLEYHDDFMDILDSKDAICFDFDDESEVSENSKEQVTVETSEVQKTVPEENDVQKPDSKAEIHLQYHDDFMDILDSKDTIGFDFDDESKVSENFKEQTTVETFRLQQSPEEENDIQKTEAKNEIHLEYHDDFVDILDSKEAIDLDEEFEMKEVFKENVFTKTPALPICITEEKVIQKPETKKDFHNQCQGAFIDSKGSREATGFEVDDNFGLKNVPKEEAVTETPQVQKLVSENGDMQKSENINKMYLECHDEFVDRLESKDPVSFEFHEASDLKGGFKEQSLTKTYDLQKSALEEKDLQKSEAKKEMYEEHPDFMDLLGHKDAVDFHFDDDNSKQKIKQEFKGVCRTEEKKNSKQLTQPKHESNLYGKDKKSDESQEKKEIAYNPAVGIKLNKGSEELSVHHIVKPFSSTDLSSISLAPQWLRQKSSLNRTSSVGEEAAAEKSSEERVIKKPSIARAVSFQESSDAENKETILAVPNVEKEQVKKIVSEATKIIETISQTGKPLEPVIQKLSDMPEKLSDMPEKSSDIPGKSSDMRGKALREMVEATPVEEYYRIKEKRKKKRRQRSSAQSSVTSQQSTPESLSQSSVVDSLLQSEVVSYDITVNNEIVVDAQSTEKVSDERIADHEMMASPSRRRSSAESPKVLELSVEDDFESTTGYSTARTLGTPSETIDFAIDHSFLDSDLSTHDMSMVGSTESLREGRKSLFGASDSTSFECPEIPEDTPPSITDHVIMPERADTAMDVTSLSATPDSDSFYNEPSTPDTEIFHEQTSKESSAVINVEDDKVSSKNSQEESKENALDAVEKVECNSRTSLKDEVEIIEQIPKGDFISSMIHLYEEGIWIDAHDYYKTETKWREALQHVPIICLKNGNKSNVDYKSEGKSWASIASSTFIQPDLHHPKESSQKVPDLKESELLESPNQTSNEIVKSTSELLSETVSKDVKLPEIVVDNQNQSFPVNVLEEDEEGFLEVVSKKERKQRRRLRSTSRSREDEKENIKSETTKDLLEGKSEKCFLENTHQLETNLDTQFLKTSKTVNKEQPEGTKPPSLVELNLALDSFWGDKHAYDDAEIKLNTYRLKEKLQCLHTVEMVIASHGLFNKTVDVAIKESLNLSDEKGSKEIIEDFTDSNEVKTPLDIHKTDKNSTPHLLHSHGHEEPNLMSESKVKTLKDEDEGISLGQDVLLNQECKIFTTLHDEGYGTFERGKAQGKQSKRSEKLEVLEDFDSVVKIDEGYDTVGTPCELTEEFVWIDKNLYMEAESNYYTYLSKCQVESMQKTWADVVSSSAEVTSAPHLDAHTHVCEPLEVCVTDMSQNVTTNSEIKEEQPTEPVSVAKVDKEGFIEVTTKTERRRRRLRSSCSEDCNEPDAASEPDPVAEAEAVAYVVEPEPVAHLVEPLFYSEIPLIELPIFLSLDDFWSDKWKYDDAEKSWQEYLAQSRHGMYFINKEQSLNPDDDDKGNRKSEYKEDYTQDTNREYVINENLTKVTNDDDTKKSNKCWTDESTYLTDLPKQTSLSVDTEGKNNHHVDESEQMLAMEKMVEDIIGETFENVVSNETDTKNDDSKASKIQEDKMEVTMEKMVENLINEEEDSYLEAFKEETDELTRDLSVLDDAVTSMEDTLHSSEEQKLILERVIEDVSRLEERTKDVEARLRLLPTDQEQQSLLANIEGVKTRLIIILSQAHRAKQHIQMVEKEQAVFHQQELAKYQGLLKEVERWVQDTTTSIQAELALSSVEVIKHQLHVHEILWDDLAHREEQLGTWLVQCEQLQQYDDIEVLASQLHQHLLLLKTAIGEARLRVADRQRVLQV